MLTYAAEYSAKSDRPGVNRHPQTGSCLPDRPVNACWPLSPTIGLGMNGGGFTCSVTNVFLNHVLQDLRPVSARCTSVLNFAAQFVLAWSSDFMVNTESE
jgi:hypothetical protein